MFNCHVWLLKGSKHEVFDPLENREPTDCIECKHDREQNWILYKYIYMHMFLSKLEDAPFCGVPFCGVCGVECVRILGFNMLKNHQSKFFIGGFTLKAIITHDGSGWCW